MTQRRLRQANLFGPAGFVSADDGEVIEFSQQRLRAESLSTARWPSWAARGRNTDHMVTETLIRGMYRYWREVMEAA
jgi:salicylate 5-hydroxylase large subunit